VEKPHDIIIEGRQFKPIKNGTFEHDIWISRKVREAGLANVQLNDGETPDEFMERLAAIAWGSGAVLDILGGTLMPAEHDARDWTPEMATATARFFANVTDEEGKKQLRMQIGGILFFFFASALSSSQTSRKSGTPMPSEGEERQETEGASATGIGAT